MRLYPYQDQAIRFLSSNKHATLDMPTGYGAMETMIEAIKTLPRGVKVTIVDQKVLHGMWKRNLDQYCYDHHNVKLLSPEYVRKHGGNLAGGDLLIVVHTALNCNKTTQSLKVFASRFDRVWLRPHKTEDRDATLTEHTYDYLRICYTGFVHTLWKEPDHEGNN